MPAIKDIVEAYNQLPVWIQQSPVILVLALVIVFLSTGYLYTGRTFDREITRCTQEAKDWKETALEEMRKK